MPMPAVPGSSSIGATRRASPSASATSRTIRPGSTVKPDDTVRLHLALGAPSAPRHRGQDGELLGGVAPLHVEGGIGLGVAGALGRGKRLVVRAALRHGGQDEGGGRVEQAAQPADGAGRGQVLDRLDHGRAAAHAGRGEERRARSAWRAPPARRRGSRAAPCWRSRRGAPAQASRAPSRAAHRRRPPAPRRRRGPSPSSPGSDRSRRRAGSARARSRAGSRTARRARCTGSGPVAISSPRAAPTVPHPISPIRTRSWSLAVTLRWPWVPPRPSTSSSS